MFFQDFAKMGTGGKGKRDEKSPLCRSIEPLSSTVGYGATAACYASERFKVSPFVKGAACGALGDIAKDKTSSFLNSATGCNSTSSGQK